MARLLMKLYYAFTVPISIVFILHSRSLHPPYHLTWWRRVVFGLRAVRNKHSIPTGTSYKTALVLALKLFEMPPEVEGVVMECGTWKGGTSATLSLACKIVGRKLVICDSFEGLPKSDPVDRQGGYAVGEYCGTIDEVRQNITRYGDISVCEFVKGWFNETLPKFNQKIALAFLDVDMESSLNTCVLNLWPHLHDEGYVFIDEYVGVDYCALFYSERFWKENFNRTPPGLIVSDVLRPRA